MDINFENKLLDTTEPTIPSNILFVFANKFKENFSPIVEKLHGLSFFSELKYSLEDNKYKPNLRNIISRNSSRFCIKINESAIFSNFNKCDIILLSYSTINGKNYINGFATIRINNTLEYVIIDYLCGDLKFSGIGSSLVSFIKIFTINIVGENFSIILDSIDSTTTQNFYISQFFYNITDKTKTEGHKIIGDIPYIRSEKYNYIWKYNEENIEEKLMFEDFTLPFTIKQVALSKYSKVVPNPGLINEFTPMKKLYSTPSKIIYEKGGFYNSKNKKIKRHRNKSKKTYRNKSKKTYRNKSKKNIKINI